MADLPVAETPRRLSTVTLRPERFGAIAFNPFFAEEVQLDSMEGWIMSLFTGEYSWPSIERATADRFNLPIDKARLTVWKTAEKLQRIGGLTREERPTKPQVEAPPIPQFAEEGPALKAPKQAIWDVTYACNLTCPHCLTASGKAHPDELDTGGAKRVVDRLAEAQVLYLALSGGEPLLRPDILDIIEYATSQNLRVDVATNGVVLTDRVRRGLRDLPIFQVQVSIDGIGSTHDRFRGRIGAFEAACTTVRTLRSEGIGVSLSTTATSENIDQLDELIDLAVSLGCRGYKAIPFIAAGRGREHENQLRLTADGLRRLGQTLVRRQQELLGILAIATDGGFPFLWNSSKPSDAYDPSDDTMGCSAGYDTISIGADGTAYPCPFLETLPLGNVVTTPIQEIWARAPVLHALRNLTKSAFDEPCRSCTYAPEMCHGGCRAAALLAHGSLVAPDPTCSRAAHHHHCLPVLQ
ncbi:MAG: radical SAM protein [Polyangiaceae bacterium]|nr:radical SAM protein [Polyangiaceae bacterium]